MSRNGLFRTTARTGSRLPVPVEPLAEPQQRDQRPGGVRVDHQLVVSIGDDRVERVVQLRVVVGRRRPSGAASGGGAAICRICAGPGRRNHRRGGRGSRRVPAGGNSRTGRAGTAPRGWTAGAMRRRTRVATTGPSASSGSSIVIARSPGRGCPAARRCGGEQPSGQDRAPRLVPAGRSDVWRHLVRVPRAACR